MNILNIMKNFNNILKLFPKQYFNNELSLFKILTIFVFGLSLLTILLGPYVRSEDAGLACPDWPLCHGYVIPPLDYKIYLEFIHRLIAGILGIVYLFWFFIGIKNFSIRKKFLPYLILSFLVLTVQIFLGRETITKQLQAYIVKFHLLNAIFYISIIYYILYRLFFDSKIEAKNRFLYNIKTLNFLTTVFIVLLFIQIFLGGRVSSNYVGLVCSNFPHCYTEVLKEGNREIIQTVYIPPLKGGFEMHFSHRFFGIILFFISVYLLYVSYKNQFMLYHYLFFTSLLVFQIFLGIINITFDLPTLIRVLHSFTATILFLTILHIKFKLNTLIN